MEEHFEKIHFEYNKFEKLLSCCPTNKENFDHLIRLIQRNVVIPFFGAGVSINMGYPGWHTFLHEEAKKHYIEQEIDEMLSRVQYERAAGRLKEHLKGDTLEHILIQTFGDHVYKKSSGIKELDLIPKIFRNLMLTTNYDEVIEMLYAKVNGEYIEKLTPRSLNDINVICRRIACGEPTLIKLHGDVATREFVLTEEEYNKIYGEKILDIRLPLPALLRDVLLSKTILFLGCSLEDDRTLRVIEQSQIDGSMSFAFLPLPVGTQNKCNPWKPILEINGKENEAFTKRKQFLGMHNIIPIWYPSDNHEAFSLFLCALADIANSNYQLSATATREKSKYLLNRGEELEKMGKSAQALYNYIEAENLISNNLYEFSGNELYSYFQKIKAYYDLKGDMYERRALWKKLCILTEQNWGYYSIEMASIYHDIAYTYEKYSYYKLFLRAAKRAADIAESYYSHFHDDNSKDNTNALNQIGFIFTSLGYAYLMNDNIELAKTWYTKAEEWKDSHTLNIYTQAFVNNGLHYYYYNILNDSETALKYLDIALKQRCSLKDESAQNLPIHIINTHSNKIRIYLAIGDLQKAMKEYEDCRNEYNIWNRLANFPDGRQRILTDHGDILMKSEKYEAALEEYKTALQYRKYLHFVDDFISANLYLKIAEALHKIPNKNEEALEYMIQGYIIQKKMLGTTHAKVLKVKDKLYRLCENIPLETSILEQRLSVQYEFLNFRADQRMEGREEELIEYLEL